MSFRRLVVSGINLVEGGPLAVLQRFLAACERLPEEWQIVAFVHDRNLIASTRIQLIEVPETRGSWLRRLLKEWFGFRRYAKILKPDLWVSLHDITPCIGAVRQVVYCHNAVPFCPLRSRDFWFEPRLLFFRLGYPWVYRLNIRRNSALIVQQSWMRSAFRKWVGPRMPIIVAYPAEVADAPPPRRRRARGAIFIYPTLARPFKNVELLCRAIEVLERNEAWHSVLLLTLSGTENRYARWLAKRFKSLRTVSFIGKQTQEQMQHRYREADSLLFPSRMESWGLPITEARQYQLAIFAADLPYAHETVGNYDRADFIDLEDYIGLADKLLRFQQGTFTFAGGKFPTPSNPFASTWDELTALLAATATVSVEPKNLRSIDAGN